VSTSLFGAYLYEIHSGIIFYNQDVKFVCMLPEIFESELREGNFVFHSGEVLCLNHKNLDLVSFKGHHDLEGININVNWLENFGFFYVSGSDDQYTFFLSGVKIELFDSQALVTIHNNTVKNIVFVHELQNIFYALTGKELILKDSGLSD